MLNIVGRRYWYFGLSLLVMIPGLLALGFWGLPLAIDFTGGSKLEVSIAQATDLSTSRVGALLDEGFRRAWPSIRDSNISTIITCAILFWFGNTFGASIVKGFALTLSIGVGVSLFTAILATRTLLHTFLDRIDFAQRKGLFGV